MQETDQLTYRRGLIASLVGLGIQVLLFIAVGLMGVWTASPAVHAATWHVLGGLPIWIVLALIYHQHSKERAESLAAQQAAQLDEESAALFGDQNDELQLARRRLDRLYQWGLNIVSVVLAVYLLTVGITLFLRNRATFAGGPGSPDPIHPDRNTMFLMFAAGGLAFIAFISARWVSGYTRVKAWHLLRGGASYLMSCFLLALGVFGCAVSATVFGDREVFRWLAGLLPAAMAVVGLEVLLTFLLGAYRPRRPGEVPRPAFDSRLLGVLTSPESLGKVVAETINYQFGFEVSRSWFYRLLGKAVTPLTLFAAGFLLALSCIVIVRPDERAVVMQFGRLVGQDRGPGFHFKLPWPIQTAEAYPVGRVHEVQVGMNITGLPKNKDAILWDTDSDSSKVLGAAFFLTAPTVTDKRAEASSASGMGLIAAEVTVQYRVSSLTDFLSTARQPEAALSLMTEREVSRYFASKDVDTLLTRGRLDAGEALSQAIQAELDRTKLGLQVVFVAVTGVHPPMGPVSRSFHGQIDAVQQRQTRLQEAEKDAITTLAKVAGSAEHARRINAAIQDLDTLRTRLRDAKDEAARKALEAPLREKEADIEALLSKAKGESAELIHAARAYRWGRVINERSAAMRFEGELAAYEAAPRYYTHRRFYEVLAEGLTGRRKYILLGEEAGAPVFDVDLTDASSGIDSLLGNE